jgi:segregation and condensation protein B
MCSHYSDRDRWTRGLAAWSQLPWSRERASGAGWLLSRRRSVSPDDSKPEISEEAPDRLSSSKSSYFAEKSQPDSKQRVVEAVLMIAREPLSARKIASLAELADPTEARSIARQLNEQYDSHGYAFRVEEVAGGMQLLTRPQFATWLRRLEVPGEVLLSQGMLETLAIVAYRQPLLRAEMEAIRGVSCDEVLRQLMQRDLVRICGRHEDLGRPYLYGTTKRFLELFGLQSLDSLPRAQKIRNAEAETATRLAGDSSPAQDMEVEN